MPEDRRVCVVFRGQWGIYNLGETAGFLPKKAKELVNAGIADWPAKAGPPSETAATSKPATTGPAPESSGKPRGKRKRKNALETSGGSDGGS